jgi:hypothetical protein
MQNRGVSISTIGFAAVLDARDPDGIGFGLLEEDTLITASEPQANFRGLEPFYVAVAGV